MSAIDVIIPTFRRPDSLARALASVIGQEGVAGLLTSIVVVDNDPAGSARSTAERLRRDDLPLTYIHAPEPGVSNARNAGVAATRTPLIAFLDDDEEAPPHWLSALYATHTALGADVTFGPVRGRADASPPWKRGHLERFFSRFGPTLSGLTDTVHGCGNSMMTRATALAGLTPFDVRANETGGEDDRLFERLRTEDRRFGWCAEAWVWEHATPNRQTARYALTRAFGYGQTPAQSAARAGHWIAAAGWMAIGAVQFAVFAAAALAAAPVGRARALSLADRAARGLGKVFWFKRLRFYGAAAARPASSRSGSASLKAMAVKITQ